jgi:glucose-6-phosphate 1-dehydrogenase
MAGAGALFTREDAAEAAWAAVDPVLEKQHEVRRYYRRSWGPKKADAIIAATAVGIIPVPKKHPEHDVLSAGLSGLHNERRSQP